MNFVACFRTPDHTVLTTPNAFCADPLLKTFSIGHFSIPKNVQTVSRPVRLWSANITGMISWCCLMMAVMSVTGFSLKGYSINMGVSFPNTAQDTHQRNLCKNTYSDRSQLFYSNSNGLLHNIIVSFFRSSSYIISMYYNKTSSTYLSRCFVLSGYHKLVIYSTHLVKINISLIIICIS